MQLKTAFIAMLLSTAATAAFGQATVDTRPPNGTGQQPQSADQTRAPLPEQLVEPSIAVIADDLPQLWSLEFLPEGEMLVTAKEGRLLLLAPDGTIRADVEGVPAVDASGQGGLLDVALPPDHAETGRIFFSFAEPREGGNGTSVARATLITDGTTARLEDLQVIFRQTPTVQGSSHFGSRLAFGQDGELFVTVGERSDAEVRVQAQDPSSGIGKVFRVDQDGQALQDNPFINIEGALPEVWSLGHRNMQSATVDAEGRLWTVEHGPRGGDELNMPLAGLNYGWPDVTYGVDYSGQPIGDGITASAETEQPIYYWDPVIAPSGMDFYEGDMFPDWEGSFLIGGLAAQSLVILGMEADRVVSEQRISIGSRVRDVKVASDGSIYVVTEQRGGPSQILRLTAN